MVNLGHIYEGWKKHLDASTVRPEEKELAQARVAICVACPFAKENWLSKFTDGVFGKDVLGSGIGCSICGCPVNQKAFVRAETCPEGNW